MPSKEPTNSEIYEKLGAMEATFEVRLKDILEQVKYTNGRVTKLENWKKKLDIIADWKKENGWKKDDGSGEKPLDWTKIIMATMGAIGTTLGIVIAYILK